MKPYSKTGSPPRASLVAVRNRKPATRVAYPVSRKESLDLEVEGILVRSITVQCFGQTTIKKGNREAVPLVAERRLLYGIRNTWFATKTESAVQKVRQTSVNPRGARRRWTYMPDGAFAAGWRLRVFRGGRTCTSRWNLRHAQMETLFLGKGIFPCRKKERKGLIQYSSRLHYDSHEMAAEITWSAMHCAEGRDSLLLCRQVQQSSQRSSNMFDSRPSPRFSGSCPFTMAIMTATSLRLLLYGALQVSNS